jgi:hypothetical protein
MNRPGKPRSCPSAHGLLSSTYSSSVAFAVIEKVIKRNPLSGLKCSIERRTLWKRSCGARLSLGPRVKKEECF